MLRSVRVQMIVVFLAIHSLCCFTVVTAWGAGKATPAAENAADAAAPLLLPSLADVVYQAGALKQRLAALESKPSTSLDLKRFEAQLKRADAEANRRQEQLKAFNDQDLQSYQNLAAFKGDVRSEAEAVKLVVAALNNRIRAVEFQRRRWQVDQERWGQWQSMLESDLGMPSVASAFKQANRNIDAALSQLSEQLEPLLVVQLQAAEVATKLNLLTEQSDAKMDQQRGRLFYGGMPSMLSAAYLQQLIDLVHEPSRLIRQPPAVDSIYFMERKWVFGVQALIIAVLIALLRRNRTRLQAHPQHRILAKRPLSLSLFFSFFVLSLYFGTPPPLWYMLLLTIFGVATARFAVTVVEDAWIKRAVSGIVTMMIVMQAMLLFDVPVALIRLVVLMWCLIVAAWGLLLHRRATTTGKPAIQQWFARAIVVLMTVVALSNVIGYGAFAHQVMNTVIRSLIVLIMGWAMNRLVRVVIDLGVASLPMARFAFLKRSADSILQRTILFADIVILLFVVANLLVAWDLFDLPIEALQAFFAFGVTIGEQRITIGLIATASLMLYGAFVVSWTLQALLMENVLSRRQMDAGARISIMRLLHYALVTVGFLITISVLGVELKNITIIGGALGVGIGFGMQAIVNNFVSGLIMLFERPIKVGDVIQLSDGQQGRVLNLGLRATTVQTFDRAEIVVPNGDLIANQVTNWTLGDRTMRLAIPVGVAYGSDVEKVMRVLMEVATDNERVLQEPQPVVLFLNFGGSSLDFELRPWIADFNDRRLIQSAIISEIDRRFRIENIEIPFPQRDLHLRSVDETAGKGLKGGFNRHDRER